MCSNNQYLTVRQGKGEVILYNLQAPHIFSCGRRPEMTGSNCAFVKCNLKFPPLRVNAARGKESVVEEI